ncbi:MAG: hypothetical protein ACREUC_07225 [Steroidobacteraceae bacterium]
MRSKPVLARAALAGAVLAGACATPPERLTLEGRTITVFNDSGEAWKGVEIWVNDHYRVTRETIVPDERFQVSLESFAAGFGQRFPRDQSVDGIEITATDESGDPVRLVYGSGRRR